MHVEQLIAVKYRTHVLLLLFRTIPRVGSNDRGFKGLAYNSKKVRAYSTGYLKSPSKSRDLIHQHIESGGQTNSKGRLLYLF